MTPPKNSVTLSKNRHVKMRLKIQNRTSSSKTRICGYSVQLVILPIRLKINGRNGTFPTKVQVKVELKLLKALVELKAKVELDCSGLCSLIRTYRHRDYIQRLKANHAYMRLKVHMRLKITRGGGPGDLATRSKNNKTRSKNKTLITHF